MFVIVGCWFMMREVEICCLFFSHVVLNQVTKEVTVTLPTSKTDIEGRYVERVWGCLCRAGFKSRCPYCLVCDHVVAMRQKYGDDADNMVCFPTSGEFTAEKEAVVHTIEAMVQRTGGARQ